MSIGQIKGHHLSIVCSLLVALALVAFYFRTPGWEPPTNRQMLFDFAVAWILLTYLWVQLATHLLSAPPGRNALLVDMLSSMLPALVIFYVIVEYYVGDLQASIFQINVAWLTAYAMLLDLVLDMGLAISLRRQ